MADIELPPGDQGRAPAHPGRPADAARADDPSAAGSAAPRSSGLTAERFFQRLSGLGPFRIIHQSGPSTFEAIAPIARAQVAGPFLNIICDEYHWHLKLVDLRWVESFDQIHARSGRRVLGFSLADGTPRSGGASFTRLYVHRAKDAEFDARVLAAFRELHAVFEWGAELVPTPASTIANPET